MKLSEIVSRSSIGHVLKSMGLNGIGAEVGVAFGENAKHILEKSSLKTLLLIDNWNYVPDQNSRGYGDDIKNWGDCYNNCRKRLASFSDRTKFMRMPSAEAALTVQDESLDFCYIDGNHMSPFVDQDLAAWYPKVKPGGVFGGHDYYTLDTERYRCDVRDAVDRFFSDKDCELTLLPEVDSSWYIVK